MADDITRSLNLQNIVEADIRFLILANGDIVKPEKGFIWLILSGNIAHFTATASVLTANVVGTGSVAPRTFVVIAATATGVFDIFGSGIRELSGGWTPSFITDEGQIDFAGDASATARIALLEWKVRK